MTKLIKIEHEFDWWEYSLSMTCPYCHDHLHFNDQEQPYKCTCGHSFYVDMNVRESEYPSDYPEE